MALCWGSRPGGACLIEQTWEKSPTKISPGPCGSQAPFKHPSFSLCGGNPGICPTCKQLVALLASYGFTIAGSKAQLPLSLAWGEQKVSRLQTARNGFLSTYLTGVLGALGSFLPVPLRHRKSLPCCGPHCNQGLPPCLYRVLFHSPKRFKRIIVWGGGGS